MVKGFEGLRYSLPLKNVVCPPYDIIDKDMREDLLRRSEYNYVRIVLSPYGNKVAGEVLKDWIKRGIIFKDTKPKIYILRQKFLGEERVGIIALVSRRANIYEHEETNPKYVEDRIELIKETSSICCPIFLIAENSDIRGWFQKIKKDLVDSFIDDEGVLNEFWITEEEIHISSDFLVADGHHRFKAIKEILGDREYFMAYITDEKSGLKIFPIHRGISTEEGKRIFLDMILMMKEVGYEKYDIHVDRDFITDIPEGTFVIIPDGIRVILKKDENPLFFFHRIIDNKGIRVFYYHSVKKLFYMIERGVEKCGVLFPPQNLGEIWKMAKEGKKLPRKSTYFWPKVPSGLVLQELR